MKLFRMIGRSIRDAFKSVFRNFSLSLASISSITITLIIVGVAMILSYNINIFSESIRKNTEILVFIKSDASAEEKEEVANLIDTHSNIESSSYLSKEEVKDMTIEADPSLEIILDSWDEEENPLLDEYIVKVKEIINIDDTAGDLEALNGVEEVRYGKQIIDKLIISLNVVENISYVAVVALLLVTAFLISNTIKLTIYSRKREIDIMRLVGASNMFIKFPYVLEGIVLGFIGSILPIGLISYGYIKLYEFTDGQFLSPLLKLIEPLPFIYLLGAVLLAVAVTVGMVGSYKAVRRHLKI